MKEALGQIRNGEFYEKLDQLSKPLRSSASDMVKFLTPMQDKAERLSLLIEAFNQIEKMDIEQIDEGIKKVQEIYKKISEDLSKNQLPLEKKDLEALIEKQNSFDEEAVKLFEKAVEIYKSDQKETSIMRFLKRLGAAVAGLCFYVLVATNFYAVLVCGVTSGIVHAFNSVTQGFILPDKALQAIDGLFWTAVRNLYIVKTNMDVMLLYAYTGEWYEEAWISLEKAKEIHGFDAKNNEEKGVSLGSSVK